MQHRVRPLIVLLPLWLIACSSTPVTTPSTASASTAAAAAPSSASAGAGASPSAAARSDAAPTALSPEAALGAEHSVYFDFDQAIVRNEYAALLQRYGQYLQGHPSTKAVIQGNTDERGSREYNLALGQRRAEAVKAALEVYGGRDQQIEAVSFGEERPAASGHDEAAWHQNRRADIVVAR